MKLIWRFKGAMDTRKGLILGNSAPSRRQEVDVEVARVVER